MIASYESSTARLMATAVAVVLLGYVIKFVIELYHARTALNGLVNSPFQTTKKSMRAC